MSSRSAQESPEGVVITHPNREKAIVQSTRATVILLLLVSAALILVITFGGAEVLASSSIGIEIFFAAMYVLLAFFARRWNRGVLPVASGLAVLLIIFALTGAPAWFNRNTTGFTQPALNAGLLGLLTLLVVPLQVLLVAFAMRGFQQGWNVEVEQHGGAEELGYGGPAPHPA